MGFDAFESSSDMGQPVELYEFNLGGNRFRFATGERDYTFQGNVYTATPISRSRIVATFESKDSEVTLSAPGDNTFARLYVGIIPGSFPEITIRQLHVNDPDQESIFIFQGFVSTVSFRQNLTESEIICRPITTAIGRPVPRHYYQGLCNHNLYDDRCGVSEVAFQETATVDSVDSRFLTFFSGQLSTEDPGYWTGGFVEFGDEFRQIVAQDGRQVTLEFPFLNNPVGSDVRVLPGCDHLIDGDCETIFANVVNHGGYPYVPLKNPFEGLD